MNTLIREKVFGGGDTFWGERRYIGIIELSEGQLERKNERSKFPLRDQTS